MLPLAIIFGTGLGQDLPSFSEGNIARGYSFHWRSLATDVQYEDHHQKDGKPKLASNRHSSLTDQGITAFGIAFIGTVILNFTNQQDLALEIAVYGFAIGTIGWVVMSLVTWDPAEYFWVFVLPLAGACGVGVATGAIQAIG